MLYRTILSLDRNVWWKLCALAEDDGVARHHFAALIQSFSDFTRREYL